MERINPKQLAEGILAILELGKHEKRKTISMNSKKLKNQVEIISVNEEIDSDNSAKGFVRSNRVAPL